MKTTPLNSDMYLIDDFLSAEECRALILHSETKGYEPAKVNIDGEQVMMTMVRNNERLLEKDYNRAERFWKKLKPVHDIPVGNSTPIGLNEMFRYYKYSGGQRFKRHRDGSFIRSDKEYSLYTFLIFLNEDFEGGQTKFADIDITPKTGNALVFKHELRHEGTAVTSGTKYVLRSDIMYQLTKDE